MDKTVAADLYRYGRLKGISGLLKGMRNPCFRYVYFFRIGNKYSKYHPLGFFSRLALPFFQLIYGINIPLKAKIGEGLYIGHPGTIRFNINARMGKNCNLTHNVTIGIANRGRLKGVPTIGDKVWIGTGAVIVGNIKIGSNVLIAPNSFVNFDVPDCSLVIGNPGTIHKNGNPTEDYINNTLN